MTSKRVSRVASRGTGVPRALPALALAIAALSATTLAQDFAGESFKGNEDALARKMTAAIKQVVQQRYAEGEQKRFNQAKSLGCFEGQFSVMDNLPANLSRGLFAKPQTYPAMVRFANASTTDDGDKDLRGMSVRVKGIPGQTIWGEPGRQDFVLNSHPVLFAATPEEFLDFIEAQRDDNVIWHLLTPTNWDSLFILLKARDHHTSPFDIRYWSTTPFLLGEGQAVKYSARPCSDYKSEEPDTHTNNYLRAAMNEHLDDSPVCFDFMVQTQTNNDDMPIEDASEEWDEGESPFVPVAQLTFTQQEFLTAEALADCEQVAFNPWQSLAEHRPLGRMNYVRREIYAEMAAHRKAVNQAR